MASANPLLSDRMGDDVEQPHPVVRHTVRDLLLSSAAYHSLDQAKRQEIARALVQVCQTAVSLIKEEARSDGLVAAQSATKPGLQTISESIPVARPPLALAQTAGEQFSGVSAERVAGTTRAILNAVSFPRFVTELINGVFKALVDSNQQQMHGYVELIRNVAASTEGFADTNMAPDRARQWLVETFPGSFTLEGGPDEDTDPRDAAEEAQESRIRLKEGGSMPTEAALRTTLGIAEGESIPSGDPENSLVPFARRALARQRQQMLATMVMLGMQRIVIESGRLNASMRFHIDTRSAAQSESGSRFDFQNRAEASGRFGAGPWGIEAKMTNTIGYVSTQQNQSTEEMNTDLDLNSSVELYFKTDYVPLDRLAGAGQQDRIRVNTLNPDAEERAARTAREQRVSAARTAEGTSSSNLQRNLQHQSSDSGPEARPTGTASSGGTQQTSGGTQQPSGGTQQTPGGTQQTPGGTQQTPGGTQQPSGGTQQPSGGTQQTPGGTRQPSGGTQQPSGGTQQPSGGTRQPSGGTQQPSGGTRSGGGSTPAR